MTNGTSQGLFIVVSIVIFGIFVLMADNVLGIGLTDSLVNLAKVAIERVDMGEGSELPSDTPPIGEDTLDAVFDWDIVKDDADLIVFEDMKLAKIVADTLGIQMDKITYGDLKTLEDLTITESEVLDSLKGLEYATNLKTINLALESLRGQNRNLLGVLPVHTQVNAPLKYGFVNADTTSISKETPIYVRDVLLRQAIRKTLGIEAPKPITKGDMDKLTTLEVPNNFITYLDGLEYAQNLTSLNLSHNYIGDFDVLIDLPNLNYADIRYNYFLGSDSGEFQHIDEFLIEGNDINGAEDYDPSKM